MARPRITLGALAISLLAACGGAAKPTAATPAPGFVKTLTFLFVPAPRNDRTVASTDDVIESALVAAGYNVTTNANDPHDASIVVSGSVAEKQGIMTVVVNGQVQRTFEVHVNLTVKDGGTIADQQSSTFDASNGEATQGDGLAIVNTLTDSIRFRAWARKHQAEAAPSADASAAAGE